MTKKTKGILLGTWNALFLVLVGVTVGINVVAVKYDSTTRDYFGVIGQGVSSDTEQDATDSQYYKADFTEEELAEKEKDLNIRIMEEGTVMIKNDGSLPLKATNSDNKLHVSLFGYCSVDWQYSSTQSGGISGTSEYTLKSAFESKDYVVNPTLWDFYDAKKAEGYKFGLGSTGDAFSINEVPQSEFTPEVKNSYADYSDAAIIVLERVAGENEDAPKYMGKYDGSDDHHYLELSDTEKELLLSVKNSNAFSNIVVLVNSGNAMELGFIDEAQYGINACFTTNFSGLYGVVALPDLMDGKANPSGHLVDTFVADNFSSPAMQNMGDFRFTDSTGKVVSYSYVNYGESVYTGYRYYETRYEDKVLGQGNAGDYDYGSTVVRPFGYGLSYTTFEWSDFKSEVKDGVVNVSVTVTNKGDVAGRDVVQLYTQSPYTDYDRVNLVEKPSVSLMDYAKTDLLEPNASQEVSFSFKEDELKSYDYKNEKTYILEASSDYYLTVADNAHSAINNILAKKGKTIGDGMDSQGNASMASQFSVDSKKTLNTSVNNVNVTNLFDHAYLDDATYLTRNNWSMMDHDGLIYQDGVSQNISSYTDLEKTVYTKKASDDLLSKLAATGWEASLRPASDDITDKDIAVDQEGSLNLIDLRAKSYDDKDWDALLDKMNFKDEIYNIYTHGSSGSNEASSINKPRTAEVDGPSGISSYISGKGAGGFCSEYVLGSTWSKEIAYLEGLYLGNNSILMGGANGWYAPAINLHRTPFGGRNDEYFSEDPVLSGYQAAQEIKGAQSKGIYTYVKHFALNEQETNRGNNGSVATFGTEQSLREVYLKAFEIALTYGDTNARENSWGVMTSMNRVGYINARGNYNLLTKLLRQEWGFEGTIITDACPDAGAVVNQDLAAGIDLVMNSSGATFSSGTTKEFRVRNALREAMHHVLYTVVNSNAMNGFTSNSVFNAGIAVYVIILIVLDALAVLGIGTGEFFIIRKFLKKQ